MSARVPHGDPTRLPAVALLLVLAVVLLAVLALQAQRAVRSHRETAERILRDYADLAASGYAARIGPELEFYAFAPPLDAIADTLSRIGRLPEPRPVEVWTDDTTRLSIDLVRTSFVLPLAGGPLATAGETLGVALASWLADTLRAHAREVWRHEWPSAVLVGVPHDAQQAPHDPQRTPHDGSRGREPCTLVFVVRPAAGAAPATIEGFEAKLSGLSVYFNYALNVRPLLPPALTRGTPQDSLVSIVVSDPAGRVVFRSDRSFTSRYVAEHDLGARFGGLRVRAALHPATAHILLMEGPPRRLLPTLAALTLLVAALLAGALLIVRREAALSRARADFVASVSHELRTPLAQIRLFAETLLLGRVRSDDERRRSLHIINQEARRLGDLVDNVLHVTGSERGPSALGREPTDLAALLAEVADRFDPLASAAGVTIARAFESRVSAPVDAGAVRRMVTNLLDNAVKYGPAGQTVTLRLSFVDGMARIAVEDEGPGVPLRDRSRIWERFVRLDPAVAGTGIGLSVVRDLAEQHGGRAWVEGAPVGARFVVSLPGGAANP